MSGGLSIPEPKLVGLGNALNRVFRGKTLQESSAAVSDYKVFICEEEADFKKGGYGNGNGNGNGYGRNNNSEDSGGAGNRNRQSYGSNRKDGANGIWVKDVNGSGGGNTKKRILNFWAFSPGIAMEELKKLGVRTIILTSGTLSPMASFKEDMKLPFPIQLENKHVIQDKQIWVGCLSFGSNGKQLNSGYKVRETSEYKDEIGGTILNIIRTMAGQGGTGTIGAGIPPGAELKGGILVFFPSYGVMNNCVDRWKETGMLDKLSNVGGAVVIEPKGSGLGVGTGTGTGVNGKEKGGSRRGDRWNDSSSSSSSSASSNNNSDVGGFQFSTSSNRSTVKSIDDDDSGDNGIAGAALGGVIKEFEATLASRGRCVLLAVCRYLLYACMLICLYAYMLICLYA